jgi:hypothetical protein
LDATDTAAPPGRAADADAGSGGAGDVAMRFVNLWADGGRGEAVAVYVRRGPLAEEELLFPAVGFGQSTAYVPVPGEATLLAYRAGAADTGGGLGASSFIASSAVSSWSAEGAERMTVMLAYARPLREGRLAGQIAAFHDAGDRISGGTPAREVDGVLLVAWVAPAVSILDGDRGFRLGVPGTGCLRLAGGSPNTTGGGTAIIGYDVAPGPTSLAAHAVDDTRCDGPTRIDAIDVEIPDGRSYIVAYGTGPDDLRLLFLRAE